MHKSCLLLFLLPALAFGAPSKPPQPPKPPPDLQDAIDLALTKVYPALVNISVVVEQTSGGREVRQQGTGSGTILDAEGHVLTNHHVAGKASRVICTLSSKEEIPAEVVGTDAMTDLTLLKLKLSERKDPSAPLPAASMGDSDSLAVGDYVLAMGSPLGMARSVTLGIVSNKERPVGLPDLDGEPTGTLTLWIQHDALINPGNSGGPLVNLRGEVVGINEAGTGTGVGFAIPSNLAKVIVSEILRNGRVRRGWLGVIFQPLLKGGEEKGALVGSVEPGSPAAAAGLQVGDILLAYEGVPLTVRFHDEIPLLYRRIAETPVGKVVELVLRRDGQPQILRVALGEDGPAWAAEQEIRLLGLTACDITRAMARRMRLAGTEGVFLSGVQAGGIVGMAKPSIQGGDILKAIDGKPMRSLQDLLDWVAVAKPEEKKTVVVAVERGGSQVLSALTVTVKEDEPRGTQVSKAWLGCNTQVLLKPLAEAMGLGSEVKGVRITQIFPGTPAQAGGLQVGDIVTHVADQAVNATQEGHNDLFVEMVRKRKIGEKAVFKVLREGQVQEVEVLLGASPVEPKDAVRLRDRDFEFVAREITFADRAWARWDEGVKGCLVDQVEPSGWAGFSGLSRGDLIQQLNGLPVENLDSLRKILEALKRDKPTRVVLLLRRGLNTGYLSVEPQWED